MTYVQQAIEKAIERLKENPLDRERWIQAGKAMGWENGISEEDWKNGKGRNNWRESWHFFIDHLASGKTPEDFFKELFNIKKL